MSNISLFRRHSQRSPFPSRRRPGRSPGATAAVACLAYALALPGGAAHGQATCEPVGCTDPMVAVFEAGENDGFALPTEPTSPSQELLNFLAMSKPFDDLTMNKQVGHTFTGLPPNIVSAQLEIRLQAHLDMPDNDSLHLEFQNPGFAWGNSIANLSGLAWDNGDQATLILDLGNLPPSGAGVTSVLCELADGDLDVFVQDDSAVDYMVLTVTYCPEETCIQPPWGLVGWWPFNEPDQGVSGTFRDLARGHDGTARFAPTAIDGVVGRAARFDGGLDQVVVQDAPALDLPSGVDLSIDFWIRTQDTGGVSVILEKRTSAPSVLGYQVFLFNGQVGLQLAEGIGSNACSSNPATSACTNYVSNAFVADGEWHFVAVTVNRDDPQGGRWYLDGDEVGPTFNPTLRDGSLANDAQLLIGAGDPNAPSAGSPFAGDLDELEIARRVFTAAEIQALYEAGSQGKCTLSVDAPWDEALCLGQDNVVAQISVCNWGGDASQFEFDFQGLPPMPFGVPHSQLCKAAGPTQFLLLGNEPLMIPAGQCRTTQVQILNPPALTSGQASCYQVTVTNVETGQSRSDFGFIPVTNEVCCNPLWPVTSYFGAASARPVVFTLEDTGLGASSLDVEVLPFQSDATAPPVLRLDGAAPGETIRRTVTFGPDGLAQLEVPVELTDDFAPLTPYDVVLAALNGDEEPEFLASATVLPTPDPCPEGLNALCLSQERFRVDARWRTTEGNEGASQAVPLTSDTGFFWFFRDSNLELVVKVLDACSFNNRFWVFAGGLTNVEVDLTVTDLLTGESRSYTNPLNTPFQPIQDTDAFATCDAGGESGLLPSASLWRDLESTAGAAPAGPVVKNARPGDALQELPLNGDRFTVEVKWATPGGESGEGQGVPITSDTGYFWFFEASNVELVVKVLDACSFNNRFWVFAGGLTNVEVELTISDTVTGFQATYVNPQGTPFQPIQDTSSFATCP